ncbi:hypothetical protein BCR32DRAFT_287837 [Anaeromyces robustus]|uniref:Uncharacterized protein n=1 Tax=Anaeromyces robustus TaxID=1754192 RepID=A0A1Y1VQC5_9FUNG|nr:hypothetical protein BCR32DRAFT_287837 [Anaeromyces robustus]|eukprot:ORX63343.1 hypothetical protein BCR32DRAFT_287837 [Anaeromyces robustus]
MMQAGNKHIRYRHGWECLWRIMRSGLVMDWLVGKLVGADKNKPKPDHEIKRLNN